MSSAISQRAALKLSICITTFNRSAFIGETLDSILTQVTNDCEIVVLDSGLTDDTERVMLEYTRRCDRLRYIRQEMNNGFDRDCDRVVELARGEYCWLMPDDDLLKPGAVAIVMQALRRDPSLIMVNVEKRDLSMLKVLQHRWLEFDSDRVYRPEEMDRLFVEIGDVLKYAGMVIIKRAIWLARERERYYGSWFVYLGVIFQERLPGEAIVIAEPLISHRMGNAHAWSSQVNDILLGSWPSLVASLALSEWAKRKVGTAEPWRNSQHLLWLRARGNYSLTEYRRWIRPRLRSIREMLTPTLVALLPGALVNVLFVLYFSVTRRRYRGMWQPEITLQLLGESRFHFRNWRVFKRAW